MGPGLCPPWSPPRAQGGRQLEGRVSGPWSRRCQPSPAQTLFLTKRILALTKSDPSRKKIQEQKLTVPRDTAPLVSHLTVLPSPYTQHA